MKNNRQVFQAQQALLKMPQVPNRKNYDPSSYQSSIDNRGKTKNITIRGQKKDLNFLSNVHTSKDNSPETAEGMQPTFDQRAPATQETLFRFENLQQMTNRDMTAHGASRISKNTQALNMDIGGKEYSMGSPMSGLIKNPKKSQGAMREISNRRKNKTETLYNETNTQVGGQNTSIAQISKISGQQSSLRQPHPVLDEKGSNNGSPVSNKNIQPSKQLNQMNIIRIQGERKIDSQPAGPQRIAYGGDQTATTINHDRTNNVSPNSMMLQISKKSSMPAIQNQYKNNSRAVTPGQTNQDQIGRSHSKISHQNKQIIASGISINNKIQGVKPDEPPLKSGTGTLSYVPQDGTQTSRKPIEVIHNQRSHTGNKMSSSQQSPRDNAKSTTPSFALVSMGNTGQILRGSKLPHIVPDGTINLQNCTPGRGMGSSFYQNPPIIATRNTEDYNINKRDAAVSSSLEIQLRYFEDASRAGYFDRPPTWLERPNKVCNIIDYSQAISAAGDIKDSKRPNEILIDQMKQQAKEDLMKYSITRHYPPYSPAKGVPRNQLFRQVVESRDSVEVMTSPRTDLGDTQYAPTTQRKLETEVENDANREKAQQAIALTASRNVPQVDLVKKISVESNPEEIQDQQNSVLSQIRDENDNQSEEFGNQVISSNSIQGNQKPSKLDEIVKQTLSHNKTTDEDHMELIQRDSQEIQSQKDGKLSRAVESLEQHVEESSQLSPSSFKRHREIQAKDIAGVKMNRIIMPRKLGVIGDTSISEDDKSRSQDKLTKPSKMNVPGKISINISSPHREAVTSPVNAHEITVDQSMDYTYRQMNSPNVTAKNQINVTTDLEKLEYYLKLQQSNQSDNSKKKGGKQSFRENTNELIKMQSYLEQQESKKKIQILNQKSSIQGIKMEAKVQQNAWVNKDLKEVDPLLIEEEQSVKENLKPPSKMNVDEKAPTQSKKSKERAPSPLFNELNMQEKMLIQDNLEKMYARFQAKNFNAHFKKQKMPFAHHDHPIQYQYPTQKYGTSIQSEEKKLHEKALQIKKEISVPVKKKLSKETKKASENLEDIKSLSQSIEELAIRPGSNIMPAPHQIGDKSYSPKRQTVKEPFQNRLIQKRISEEMSPESNQIAKVQQEIKDQQKNKGYKSHRSQTGSSAAFSEQFNIVTELKEINVQLRNLQDVYAKNQEVLRQIKIYKINKSKAIGKGGITSRSNSKNTPPELTNRSKNSDLIFQEIAIQQQQEELQKALLQSQMKNLQIQQKLKQKSELQMQILDAIVDGKYQSIKGPFKHAKAINRKYKPSIPMSKMTAQQLSPRLASPEGIRKLNLRLNLDQVKLNQITNNIEMLKKMYKSLDKSQDPGMSLVNKSIPETTPGGSPQKVRELQQYGQNLVPNINEMQIFQNAHIAQNTSGGSQTDCVNKASVAVRMDTEAEKELAASESITKIIEGGQRNLKKDNTEESFMPVENLNVSRNVANSNKLPDDNEAQQQSYRIDSERIVSNSQNSSRNEQSNTNIQPFNFPATSKQTGRLDTQEKTIATDILKTNDDSPQPSVAATRRGKKVSNFNIQIGCGNKNDQKSNVNKSLTNSKENEILALQSQLGLDTILASQASPLLDNEFRSSGFGRSSQVLFEQKQLNPKRIFEMVEFQRQNILDNFEKILAKDNSVELHKMLKKMGLTNEELDERNKIYKQILIQDSEQPFGFGDAIEGGKITLLDHKEESAVRMEREQLIRKLDQTYLKVKSCDSKMSQRMKSPGKLKEKITTRRSKLGLPAPNDTMLTPIQSGNNKNINSPLVSSMISPPDSPTIIQGIHEFVKLGAGLDNETETQLQAENFGQNSRTPPSQAQLHNKQSHNINADIMTALQGNIESHTRKKHHDTQVTDLLRLTQNSPVEPMVDVDLKDLESIRSLLNLGDKYEDKLTLHTFQQDLLHDISVLEHLQNIQRKLKSRDNAILDRGTVLLKYKKFKQKVRFLRQDENYLNQQELTEKNLAVDLYYKQRQKLLKDKYIDHVRDRLQTTMTEIEDWAKDRSAYLVKTGGLFADDLEVAKNPTQDENELSLKERMQIKKEKFDLQYQKDMIRREFERNEELSSDRSKYGEKLDIDSLTKEIYEDKNLEQELNSMNQEMTKVDDYQAEVPSTTHAVSNDLKNGYEMSVQKLAKANLEDSIISQIPRPVPQTSNQNRYFGRNGRSRAKSNVPDQANSLLSQHNYVRNTAPGGPRTANQFLENTYGHSKEDVDDNQTTNSSGLIHRSELRFGQLLQFQNNVIKKDDVKNYQDNVRLYQIRNAIKTGSSQIHSKVNMMRNFQRNMRSLQNSTISDYNNVSLIQSKKSNNARGDSILAATTSRSVNNNTKLTSQQNSTSVQQKNNFTAYQGRNRISTLSKDIEFQKELSISDVKKIPEKDQDREYLAYISNQRSVLPVLKDVMSTQIKQRLAATTSREAEGVQQPQKTPAKNANKTVEFENDGGAQLSSGTEFANFQIELFKDRLNRKNDQRGLADDWINQMKRANPELSDQKQKDNAYFNGVAVKKPPQKQNLPQLFNRKPRQGSVPVQSKKSFKFYGHIKQDRFKNLENSLLLKYPEAEISSLMSKADITGETNGIRQSIEHQDMEADPLSFSGAASQKMMEIKSSAEIRDNKKVQRGTQVQAAQVFSSPQGSVSYELNKIHAQEYKISATEDSFRLAQQSMLQIENQMDRPVFSQQQQENLRLKVKEHLIKFEPINPSEFIYAKPKMRSGKEESMRIVGGSMLNPKELRKQQQQMKALQNQQEQEVKDFLNLAVDSVFD